MSKRLENAITKLYNAFHNDTLHPECCKQCAVGNILNNTDSWKNFSDEHGSISLNYVGLVNEKFGRRFAGYTPLELLRVEKVFLQACGYQIPLNKTDWRSVKITKDLLFRGLEQTVSFLCKLDNITNVMDCSAIFNYKVTDELAVLD